MLEVEKANDADEVIRASQRLLDAGDVANAAAILEAHIPEFGDNPLLLRQLAAVRSLQGSLQDRVSLLERALDAHDFSKRLVEDLQDDDYATDREAETRARRDALGHESWAEDLRGGESTDTAMAVRLEPWHAIDRDDEVWEDWPQDEPSDDAPAEADDFTEEQEEEELLPLVREVEQPIAARARRLAADLCVRYGLSIVDHKPLAAMLERRFCSSTMRVLDKELAAGAEVAELTLAHDLRLFWSEQPQFSSCVTPGGEWLDRQVSLSWTLALDLVRSFHGLPDQSEIECALEIAFEDWKDDPRLRLCYTSFRVYVQKCLVGQEYEPGLIWDTGRADDDTSDRFEIKLHCLQYGLDFVETHDGSIPIRAVAPYPVQEASGFDDAPDNDDSDDWADDD